MKSLGEFWQFASELQSSGRWWSGGCSVTIGGTLGTRYPAAATRVNGQASLTCEFDLLCICLNCLRPVLRALSAARFAHLEKMQGSLVALQSVPPFFAFCWTTLKKCVRMCAKIVRILVPNSVQGAVWAVRTIAKLVILFFGLLVLLVGPRIGLPRAIYLVRILSPLFERSDLSQREQSLLTCICSSPIVPMAGAHSPLGTC